MAGRLIVGDTSTYGKGTVQNLNPLRPFIWSANESASNDPGTVKITIRKFYRISGASTQLKGVMPDIVLPDTLNAMDDIGESSLPNAMPWDTIPKADYTSGEPGGALSARIAQTFRCARGHQSGFHLHPPGH